MRVITLICCLLFYAVTQAEVPNGATHSFTVTVDTAAETSTNYLHQIDLTDHFTISAIDSIIDSTKNIVVCPADDTTKYPKYVIYDSSKTCLLYFDAPKSSTTDITYRVFLGTGLSGANSTATFTNNSINNYHGFDNFSGNTFYDYTGNNNGTGTGVDTVTSEFGVGAEFDAASDNVSLGNVSEVSNVQNFTIDFVVSFSDITPTKTILSIYENATANVQIVVTAGRWRFIVTNSGSTTYGYIATAGYLESDVDYFVSMLYDGTQATNGTRLRVSVNGEEKTLSYSGTLPTVSPTMPTADLLYGNVTSALYGSLDEACIFTTTNSVEYATDRYSTLFDTTFYTVGDISRFTISISTIEINSIYGTGTFSAEPDSIYFNSTKGTLSDSSTTEFVGTPVTALGYGTHDVSLWVQDTEFPFTYKLSAGAILPQMLNIGIGIGF